MLWKNEFDLQPGVHRHYKGGLYIVTNVVTHMDNPTTGFMEPLQDPLVVYHDLHPVVKHVNGQNKIASQIYARPLSEFKATVSHNGKMVKRFQQQ